MGRREPTREDDEQALLALALRRDLGWVMAEIAHYQGRTKNAIIGQIARIRKEDLAHSDEPEGAILEAYEPMKGAA